MFFRGSQKQFERVEAFKLHIAVQTAKCYGMTNRGQLVDRELQKLPLDVRDAAIRELKRQVNLGTVGDRHPIEYYMELVRISRQPGSLLVVIAEFLLTKEAYERYVRPVIADAQYEYAEAIEAGRTTKARWILVRVWFLVVPGWAWGLAARLAGWLFSAQ